MYFVYFDVRRFMDKILLVFLKANIFTLDPFFSRFGHAMTAFSAALPLVHNVFLYKAPNRRTCINVLNERLW